MQHDQANFDSSTWRMNPFDFSDLSTFSSCIVIRTNFPNLTYDLIPNNEQNEGGIWMKLMTNIHVPQKIKNKKDVDLLLAPLSDIF